VLKCGILTDPVTNVCSFLHSTAHVYLLCYTDTLTISVTPTNPVIGEKGTAQFTAKATGVNMGNFAYQWRKKNKSLPMKVSGANGAVLTIPNLVESDEGVYYCTVTNEWGRSVKSDGTTLNVQGREIMYISLSSVIQIKILFNSTVDVQCYF